MERVKMFVAALAAAILALLITPLAVKLLLFPSSERLRGMQEFAVFIALVIPVVVTRLFLSLTSQRSVSLPLKLVPAEGSVPEQVGLTISVIALVMATVVGLRTCVEFADIGVLTLVVLSAIGLVSESACVFWNLAAVPHSLRSLASWFGWFTFALVLLATCSGLLVVGRESMTGVDVTPLNGERIPSTGEMGDDTELRSLCSFFIDDGDPVEEWPKPCLVFAP